MKTLISFCVGLMLAASVSGQGIVRNSLTTNSDPAALLVVTNVANGVGLNSSNYAVQLSLATSNGIVSIIGGPTNGVTYGAFDQTYFVTNGAVVSVRTNTIATLTAVTNIAQAQYAVAINFANAAGISDLSARSAVLGLVNELTKDGIYSKLNDAVLLNPRFNPSSKLSLFQHPFAWSNAVQSSFGASFAGNSQIYLPLTTSVVSNTIVFSFRSPQQGNGVVSAAQFVVGLASTNTSSGQWMYMSSTVGNYSPQEKQAGVYSDNGPPYNNLMMPYWIGQYTYLEEQGRLNQRKVFAITGDAHGNHTMYQDTVQAKIGLSSPAFNFLSSVVCFDAMNALYIGEDLTNNATYQAWTGEMEGVFVFNAVLTQAEINAAYSAIRWINPDTVERFYIGHSLMAPDAPGTNNYPQMVQNFRKETAWHNYAQGGSKLSTLVSYPTTAITSLPTNLVTDVEVYIDSGINDVYVDNASAATIIGYFTNTAANFRAAGAKVSFCTIDTVWTNVTASGYTYSAAKELVSQSANAFLYTNVVSSNAWVQDIIPKDQLVWQGLVDTNYLYSTDGLHFFGSQGDKANMAVAGLFLKRPTVNGFYIPNPNYVVWPWDVNNNLILNGSTQPTRATNAQTTLVNLAFPISDLTTNATFAFVGFTNVNAQLAKNYQTTVLYITNSSGALINFTVPANCHTNAGSVCNITNETKVEFFVNANRWTNCISTPLW